MKTSIVSILFIFAFACKAQEPVDSRQREIVFSDVSVIPMDKEEVIENQVVVVKDGKITAMGDAGKTNYSGDALVVDGTGKFLIPGLAEMHAHVPPVDDLDTMKNVLLLFAVNGVTTIRGMLGHPRHIELRNKIESGEILGPRFYTAGPGFSGNSVSSPEAGAEMVRQQKEAGYDFLKMFPGLDIPKFDAITKTAKEVSIPFAGHVPFDVGVWRAINAGYASVDHMDGFIEALVPGVDTIGAASEGLFGMFIADRADTSRIPELMEALREHHIWVVPTQCLAERWFGSAQTAEELGRESEMKYMGAETITNWIKAKNDLTSNPKYTPEAINKLIALRRKLIYECNKNGLLLLGSDAPQVFDVPGFSVHHELKYLVDAGLTPYEALYTGTVNPAIYFNHTSDRGVIKVGAVSDLVLLSGNPLPDIEQVKNIEGVMVGSNWLSKEWIDTESKKLVKQ